jgi:hypothetical protein
VTELDRDEFDAELEAERLTHEWATAVDEACARVSRAIESTLVQVGPDIDQDRDPATGIPGFILRA